MSNEIPEECNFIMNVVGPDDVHYYRTMDYALIDANSINKLYLSERLKTGDETPLCIAQVLTRKECEQYNAKQALADAKARAKTTRFGDDND